MYRPPPCHSACPHGDTLRDTVNPVAEQSPVTDRGRTTHQDEERCLECILDIVRIGKDTPANAKDHGSVALHERLERRRITPVNEPL
jgi:hypothetical protein